MHEWMGARWTRQAEWKKISSLNKHTPCFLVLVDGFIVMRRGLCGVRLHGGCVCVHQDLGGLVEVTEKFTELVNTRLKRSAVFGLLLHGKQFCI